MRSTLQFPAQINLKGKILDFSSANFENSIDWFRIHRITQEN